MRFTKFMTVAAVALSMTSAPVLAQAAQAPTAADKLATLSGKNVRQDAKLSKASEGRGRGSSIILLIIAGVLVGLGIYLLVDSDGDPQSP